jgi:hypothetical protein
MKRSGMAVPLDRLVRQSVRWTECRCGWLHERGGQCRNPVHKTGVFTSESEPNKELSPSSTVSTKDDKG